MNERLLVLIPALNAADTIGQVVTEARNQVEPVVVIDDGSTDRTSEVARQSGATVLRHALNRGKGAALRTGFAWALERGFDAVITIDADGQHLASEIAKFVSERAASRADLIIGGRSHLFGGMLPRRRTANRFSAWCISKCARTTITDSQSGFRLYSAKLIREVPLRASGFDMESEVIVLAGRAGYPMVTIPIELGYVDGVPTSHYRPLVDTIRIARTVGLTLLRGAFRR